MIGLFLFGQKQSSPPCKALCFNVRCIAGYMRNILTQVHFGYTMKLSLNISNQMNNNKPPCPLLQPIPQSDLGLTITR